MHRRPLAHRPLQLPVAKRPRSPDALLDPSISAKRIKPAPSTQALVPDKARERRHAEREQQKAEFKEKYTRAFPGFAFYFEDGVVGSLALDAYEEMIERLGGSIVKFFDTEVTHFISNRAVPIISTSTAGDKENNPKPLSRSVLRSPIKLRGCTGEESEYPRGIDPMITAANLGKKIWNTVKLESVLTRLLDSPSPSTSTTEATTKRQTPSLARLLKSEQIHGTTERDPTQKRHDFKYFTRGSKFVLVEDLRQELATVAVYEYPVVKAREGAVTKFPWPVLHCHPQARGPFIPFDEKEKRRWEKQQRTDRVRNEEKKESIVRLKQPHVVKRRAEVNIHAKRTGDLRRSVSMNNLHRRANFSPSPDDEYLIHDCDIQDPGNASGFLASGTATYMAASGNSVGITSTTGTTSTTGYTARNVQLPSALSGRMKQHVVTSLKFPSNTADKENRVLVMAPPAIIPGRQPMLRKSRSTNTFKLPKREEGSKPGYCESCRMKFDDFKLHVQSRKHQRFAMNDANFLQLDCVLARVRRRTKQELFEERLKREAMRKSYCAQTREEPHPRKPPTIKRREPEYDEMGDALEDGIRISADS